MFLIFSLHEIVFIIYLKSLSFRFISNTFISPYLYRMKNYSILLVILLFSCNSFSQNIAGTNAPPFIPVRTIGKFTQLGYSLGQDRLGSAKLGYIDTLVLLKVVDSVNNLYKVQLSQNHSAYVFKSDVKRDLFFTEKPFYLMNNWFEKFGKDNYDTLSISMDERLPYKSWMEIDPSKIIIDVYGAQSNTNWITQFSGVKEIKNVYMNQIEDDVVRVTIELQHKQPWGYTVGYNGNRLFILVKKQPPVLQLQKLTIAIDAGHGGTNLGAQGINTLTYEKDVTILFAKALQKYLKALGVKNIIMTRNADTMFGNTDRVLWLQQQQPDLLVSLHLNSSEDTSVKGSSTYYRDIGYRGLSTALLKKMTAVGMHEYGNTGNFNFLLLQQTDFPSALLEIGFLSNPKEEKKLLTAKFQSLVAKQVYLGLVDFLNQSK
jgi:N-acetylmuramoyl-L-alanine amidase